MASLRQLRRRIRSVQNTRQITRAMQMVAAAKLRKAEAVLKSSLPYARKLKEIISRLITLEDLPEHILLKPQPEDNIALAVIAGDKGLCGAFNMHVIKQTELFLKQHQDKQVKLHLYGKKVYEFFSKRDVDIVSHHENIGKSLETSEAADSAEELLGGYPESYDTLYVIYNSFVSAVSYKTLIEKFLPFDKTLFEGEDISLSVDYIFEPDSAAIFNKILPKFFVTRFCLALAESATSEHSARMISMQNATENASELIDNLTLLRNKIRQATITKEISEIVGGAEALK